MVQAQAQQLLNQKESEKRASVRGSGPEASGQKIFTAIEHLVSALGQLEHSLQYIGHAQPSEQAQQELLLFTHENDQLRQERATLNAAINQLQSQYNDLHRVASTIYGKLDDSIRRLTQIVEH